MRPLPALIVTMLMLAATGCASRGGASPTDFDIADEDRGPSAAWPFWPAAMRVHPLSRIVDAGEGHLLEARIEFTDADEYTTRCFGFLRLELFDGDAIPGRGITGWNVDLRDLDSNQNHFDDVSRMYFMRLGIDGPVPENPVLLAEFFSTNGVDFRVEHRLK